MRAPQTLGRAMRESTRAEIFLTRLVLVSALTLTIVAGFSIMVGPSLGAWVFAGDASVVTGTTWAMTAATPQPIVVTVTCGTAIVGLPVICDALVSGGTGPYSITWDSTGTPPGGTGTSYTTIFSTKSTRSVIATAVDANLDSQWASVSVDVQPRPLTVTVACPTGLTVGRPFDCTVSASGGTEPYSGIGNHSVTENVTGIFTESFTVTDANHATATGSTNVTIAAQTLVVDFSASLTSEISGQTMSFSAVATGGTPPYSFSWDFGDNTPASLGSSVEHTYDVLVRASFNVTLTGRDASGASTAITHMVTVFPRTLSSERLDCTPKLVSVGQLTDCVFFISDTSIIPSTPQGIVVFSSDSPGDFSSSASCTVVQGKGPEGTATCHVTYTPSGVDLGLHRISARYSGDGLHQSVTLVAELSVTPIRDEVKCGGGDTCIVRSNSTITRLAVDGNKIRLTTTGLEGSVGWANFTLPKRVVPDINRVMVSVDGTKLSSASLNETMDSSDYYIFFTFRFQGPVQVEVNYAPAPDPILGLDPTLFYAAMAGVAVVVLGTAALTLRRRALPVLTRARSKLVAS